MFGAWCVWSSEVQKANSPNKLSYKFTWQSVGPKDRMDDSPSKFQLLALGRIFEKPQIVAYDGWAKYLYLV